MSYGPASESPSRLQRVVLSSRLLTSLAAGFLASGITTIIGLLRFGPSVRLFVIGGACFVLTSTFSYVRSVKRHEGVDDRLEAVVAYPSWSVPRVRTARERLWLIVVAAILGLFGVFRIVELFAGPVAASDLTALAISIGALVLVLLMLRRPPARQAPEDSSDEPFSS
jgi:hypothetical protein